MPTIRTKTALGTSLAGALEDIRRKQLQVGFFESAKYPDGIPVAYVASAHEFGVPQNKLPARPFMRPTVSEKRERWSKYIAQECVKIMNDEGDITTTLEQLGLNASGEIRKTISRVMEPPLKAATVKAKMRKLKNAKGAGNLTKPLVETGIMLNSVTYAVVDK